MLKKSVSLILSLILIMSVFAACSKNDGSDKDLVFPIAAEPLSLDPQIVNDKPGEIVVNNCLEGLVRLGANGEILPGVALNWDISSDGLTYTFHLRDNAKWHLTTGYSDILGDNYEQTFNTAVTARDFVFALRRAVLPVTNAPNASSLSVIINAEAIHSGALSSKYLGVEAVNDFTLKISLSHADSDFLNLLASPVCMPCNEAFFTATKGKYGLGTDYLLCNGPFYLSSWAHNSSLKLRKNIDYQGNSAVSPNSVSLTINPDTSTYLLKLTQGAYSASPLSADDAASVDKSAGISLAEYSNITRALCFNCAGNALKNTKLRIALCEAIKRTDLEKSLAAKNQTGYFVPACCTVGQTSFRSLSKNGYALGYNTANAEYLWNKGLKAAGYTSVAVTLLCPAEYENAMRQLFQLWQKTLGISLDITVEVLDSGTLQQKVAADDYQIAMYPVQADQSSAVGFLQNFTSGSVNNIFNYRSATYDNILKQLKKGSNSGETVAGCRKAEANLLRNGVVYPLFSESSYFALAKGVSGIYSTPAGENVCFISGKQLG